MEVQTKRRSQSYGTLEVVARKEFVREFGRTYTTSHHVTMLGPTQRGKTTLGFELLKECISEQRKCVILAGKPPGRDPGMDNAATKLNLRTVETWPPPLRRIEEKRKPTKGYVLKPHHTMTDPEVDNATLEEQFKRALQANYASQKEVITFADEGYHVEVDLGLKSYCDQIHMRGAPVSALWLLLQRGRFVSYQAYSAPEHVFIALDPDRENQKRYGDIGGVDPAYIVAVLNTLRTKTIQPRGNTISEFLYIRRSGPQIMIVGM